MQFSHTHTHTHNNNNFYEYNFQGEFTTHNSVYGGSGGELDPR